MIPVPDVSMCLNAGAMGLIDGESETFIPVAHSLRGEGFDASEDGTGRGTPIIAIQERAVSENPDAAPGGAGYSTEGAAYTLEARHHVQAVAFNAQMSEVAWAEDISETLQAKNPRAVAFDLRGREGGAMPEGPHETANIRAADGGSSRSYVAEPWAVRRLTPVECERLMGFPDGFTAIPWRGKPADQCPDGPRYKALGNSWAVNCAEWIGERIAMVSAQEAAA